MKPQAMLAGIGALAFGILVFVAFMIANPPGGNYKVSDIQDFLAKGHRPAVFVSVYVMLIAVAGLLLLLARLRDLIDGARASLFWGFSVGAVAAWLVGYALAISPSPTLAFGGGDLSTLPPTLTYALSEAGWAVMYGGGGLLLGCALITFAVGPVSVVAWLRWFTLIAGVASLAAIAWFPMFIVYIWAIVLGLWLLLAGRERVASPSAQQA